ncbi:hypothetical protein ACW95P_00315 [Candidatus Mycoplasma pogonae]
MTTWNAIYYIKLDKVILKHLKNKEFLQYFKLLKIFKLISSKNLNLVIKNCTPNGFLSPKLLFVKILTSLVIMGNIAYVFSNTDLANTFVNSNDLAMLNIWKTILYFNVAVYLFGFLNIPSLIYFVASQFLYNNIDDNLKKYTNIEYKNYDKYIFQLTNNTPIENIKI